MGILIGITLSSHADLQTIELKLFGIIIGHILMPRFKYPIQPVVE